MRDFSISAKIVPLASMPDFLPYKCGTQYLAVEMYTYAWMRRLCPDYVGGSWNFVELSNGGFFLFPVEKTQYHLVWPMNLFDGILSAEAAGIVATLYALNTLSSHHKIISSYYSLLEFVDYHPEASHIFAAID